MESVEQYKIELESIMEFSPLEDLKFKEISSEGKGMNYVCVS